MILPYATYTFKQIPNTVSRYGMIEHHGEDINDFPGTYKKGVYKGQKFIGCRKTVAERLRKKFEHSIELNDGKLLTGVNFKEYSKILDDINYTEIGYGDIKSLCVDNSILILKGYDKDFCNYIKILFFSIPSSCAVNLYDSFIQGEVLPFVNYLKV